MMLDILLKMQIIFEHVCDDVCNISPLNANDGKLSG